MKKIAMMLMILLSCSSVFAQDMYLGSDGRVGIGTDAPTSRLETIGRTDEDAIVGSTSGTGAGVYGINDTSGNYGFLGDSGFGVYGYSVGGFAGYFEGDMHVTGSLTVDGVLTGTGIADITSVNTGSGLSGGAQSGDVFLDVVFGGTGLLNSAARSDHNHDTSYSPLVHEHSGMDITSGTVAEIFIDPLITRDNEIMSLVLAADGAGSGLDADMFDGQDSSAFSPSVHDHNSLYYEMPHVDTLESRIQTLELQDETALIINAAAVASEKTRNAEPELEMWIKAAQKAGTKEGQLTFFDTDGNGVVEQGSDLRNEMIVWNGVISTFVNMKHLMNLKSPWNDQIDLWSYGIGASQTACNVSAVNNPGQITVCYYPDETFMMRSVFVAAADNNGDIVYEKSVGIVDASDMTNDMLAANGVVNQFVISRILLNEKTPFNGYMDLWINGFAANRPNCEAMAAPGQITVCYWPAEDQTVEAVFVVAKDMYNFAFYSKTVN